MRISHHIHVNRMVLLYKQLIFLSGKQLLIVLGSIVALITGFHAFMYFVNQDHIGKTRIVDEYHVSVFLFAFFVGGLLWSGQAFPALRSKEKSVDYLLTPASVFEKYLFEFINRILIFLVCFPLIYWVFTNLVTGIFHVVYPQYSNYKFQFGILFTHLSPREITLVISLALLAFTFPFAGATYFKKMPLLKTILTGFIMIGLYTGITVLMVKSFHVDDYRPVHNRILFMSNEEDAKLAGIIMAILANVYVLSISFFKLKEKEG